MSHSSHGSSNNPQASHDDHLHELPTSFIKRYIFTVDHKVIAKQFLFFGIFWAFIGAFLSVLIRWCLAFPGVPFPVLGNLLFPSSGGIIPPDVYTMLFTMHGTIMIFFAITPILIGCFGNLCIPLMIGARDMIFPWLNMLSFWLTFIGGVLMFSSFFVPLGASGVGWTSYPTLAHSQWSPGMGHTLWLLSLFFIGNSSIAGAVNYITTVIRLRAPGMTFRRLPLSIWGLFLTAILNALFLPVLTAAFILLLMDRTFGTSFFLAAAISDQGTAGDPILYQHLFWIFGHPEVYIVILPAWGFVSDFLSFFARKPAFGAMATAYSMTAITVFSAVVYGHHMFTTGMSPLLTGAFTTLTLLISIPSGIFFLNWLGTIWSTLLCQELTEPVRVLWPANWPGRFHMLHRLNGILTMFALVYLTIPSLKFARLNKIKSLRRHLIGIHLVVTVQVLLGIMVVGTFIDPVVVTLHLAFALSLWALVVGLSYQLRGVAAK